MAFHVWIETLSFVFDLSECLETRRSMKSRCPGEVKLVSNKLENGQPSTSL